MVAFKAWINENKSPDYSMDRWVRMAQELGGNITSMIGNARRKEDDLDKEEKAKKKEADKADKEKKSDDDDDKKKDDETVDVTTDKSTEGEWKKLKQIAKDRLKEKSTSTKSKK